jgi:glycolate oxidase FAD binding subunit
MASIQSEKNGGSLAIDGIEPRTILTPRTPAEAAELLAIADREGEVVAPAGGGTKLALGNVSDRVDCLVSTRSLSSVLHYEPADLTLSVEAGIRFREVQSILGERGQTLPVEVPDADRATIGGMIATAIAGPRRLGNGTLRDLLIGISVAYPNGTVGKAGGLVVKNVTGFDLMRLHLGALGTLGFIVSANFKVLPAARHEATLVSEEGSLDQAMTQAMSVRNNRLRPIALEVFGSGNSWRSAVRVEGRVATVASGIESLEAQGRWTGRFDGDESSSWWRDYLQGQSLVPGHWRVVLRCGFEPKQAVEVARAITATPNLHDISQEYWMISPGIGSAIVAFTVGIGGAESLQALQQELLGVCASVTVLSAEPDVKCGLDVWGRIPETISTMRALKAEFDPNGVLNRGRFVDRI